MTAEEKRDRREARRELQTAFRRIVVRRIGLFATNGQIEASVKIMVDRYYAEQVRPAAAKIEAQVLAQAQQRREVLCTS